MGTEEDFTVDDWIESARKPETRDMLRAALANIKDTVEIKEVRKAGGVYIKMRHKATGIEHERKAGASRSDAYIDTFGELLDKLPPEYRRSEDDEDEDDE